MNGPPPGKIRTGARCVGLVAAFCVALLGLGCTQLNLAGRAPRRVPFPNAQVVALEPSQVVTLMRRAGFSSDDILRAGLELRNALAAQGSARVLMDDHTEAIFVVHEHYVHVASRKFGSFMYDTITGQIR